MIVEQVESLRVLRISDSNKRAILEVDNSDETGAWQLGLPQVAHHERTERRT